MNFAGYPEFGYYLNKTGRPMVYSCSWPVYQLYAGMRVSYLIFKLVKHIVKLNNKTYNYLHYREKLLYIVN